jgi:hypothetical protein
MNPCSINEICIEAEGSYSCACATGFVESEGSGDEGECVDFTECQYGYDQNDRAICTGSNEICVEQIGFYGCACNSGYTMVDEACEDDNECMEGEGLLF